MSYPYPIKNWRDESEYENIEFFAWEFLRRNSAYQKDYDNGLDGKKYSIVVIKGRADPRLDYPGVVFLHFKQAAIRFFGDELLSDAYMRPSNVNEIVVKFSIENIKNLKEQIKHVEDILLTVATAKETPESRNVTTRARNKEKLTKYLRTLDAVASGAGMLEVSELLEPDKRNDYENNYGGTKAVNNYLVAGLKIAESGYLDLAKSEDAGAWMMKIGISGGWILKE